MSDEVESGMENWRFNKGREKMNAKMTSARNSKQLTSNDHINFENRRCNSSRSNNGTASIKETNLNAGKKINSTVRGVDEKSSKFRYNNEYPAQNNLPPLSTSPRSVFNANSRDGVHRVEASLSPRSVQYSEPTLLQQGQNPKEVELERCYTNMAYSASRSSSEVSNNWNSQHNYNNSNANNTANGSSNNNNNNNNNNNKYNDRYNNINATSSNNNLNNLNKSNGSSSCNNKIICRGRLEDKTRSQTPPIGAHDIAVKQSANDHVGNAYFSFNEERKNSCTSYSDRDINNECSNASSTEYRKQVKPFIPVMENSNNRTFSRSETPMSLVSSADENYCNVKGLSSRTNSMQDVRSGTRMVSQHSNTNTDKPVTNVDSGSNTIHRNSSNNDRLNNYSNQNRIPNSQLKLNIYDILSGKLMKDNYTNDQTSAKTFDKQVNCNDTNSSNLTECWGLTSTNATSSETLSRVGKTNRNVTSHQSTSDNVNYDRHVSTNNNNVTRTTREQNSSSKVYSGKLTNENNASAVSEMPLLKSPNIRNKEAEESLVAAVAVVDTESRSTQTPLANSGSRLSSPCYNRVAFSTPTSMSGSVNKVVSTGVRTPRVRISRITSTPRSLSFQRGNTLGSGGFGTVFQAILSDGTLAAVKELKLETNNTAAIDNEMRAMSSLPPHPNCVHYFGSRYSKHHYYLIMEYISGGSIQYLRKTFNALSESIFQNYAEMVLQGLNHLHQHGIIHRDIKGANVIIDEHGVAKIVDFGCCKDLNQGNTTLGGGGTPLWMAPEVCRGEPATMKSDVWSFGCLCLEMTNESGQPWNFLPGMNLQGIAYAIAQAKNPPAIPSTLSPLAQDMISHCLKLDPMERMSVDELLNHPFFEINFFEGKDDDKDDDDGLILSNEPSAINQRRCDNNNNNNNNTTKKAERENTMNSENSVRLDSANVIVRKITPVQQQSIDDTNLRQRPSSSKHNEQKQNYNIEQNFKREISNAADNNDVTIILNQKPLKPFTLSSSTSSSLTAPMLHSQQAQSGNQHNRTTNTNSNDANAWRGSDVGSHVTAHAEKYNNNNNNNSNSNNNSNTMENTITDNVSNKYNHASIDSKYDNCNYDASDARRNAERRTANKQFDMQRAIGNSPARANVFVTDENNNNNNNSYYRHPSSQQSERRMVESSASSYQEVTPMQSSSKLVNLDSTLILDGPDEMDDNDLITNLIHYVRSTNGSNSRGRQSNRSHASHQLTLHTSPSSSENESESYNGSDNSSDNSHSHIHSHTSSATYNSGYSYKSKEREQNEFKTIHNNAKDMKYQKDENGKMQQQEISRKENCDVKKLNVVDNQQTACVTRHDKYDQSNISVESSSILTDSDTEMPHVSETQINRRIVTQPHSHTSAINTETNVTLENISHSEANHEKPLATPETVTQANSNALAKNTANQKQQAYFPSEVCNDGSKEVAIPTRTPTTPTTTKATKNLNGAFEPISRVANSIRSPRLVDLSESRSAQDTNYNYNNLNHKVENENEVIWESSGIGSVTKETSNDFLTPEHSISRNNINKSVSNTSLLSTTTSTTSNSDNSHLFGINTSMATNCKPQKKKTLSLFAK